MSARGRVAILAAGTLLTMTGCAQPVPGQATTSPSAPSAAPSERPMDSEPSPTAPPADAARSVTDLTIAVMTAYADHGAAGDAWFQHLAPYLSPAAREAYSTVDPARVPVHQLVGQPTVIRQSDYLAAVQLGTDAGTYEVQFSRDDNGQWQAERISPPEAAPGS